MNSIYNYLLEANICLLIFGFFYYLVLKNETHFRFSRYYLVGSALIALVIPLLHFDNPFGENSTVPVVSELQQITLPELVNGTEAGAEIVEAVESSWSWPMTVIALYGSVTCIFLTLFFFQLYQIVQFRRLKRNTILRNEDHVLILTDGQLPTFSFFNMLFFDNSADLSGTDKQKIIDHELVHIRQWHSLDMLILELIKVIFWINPVAWWMRKSIRDVHEYLADQQVLKNADQEQYSSLLARMALKHLPLPLGHHFNRSLTLKRIKMMKSPKTQFRSWKWISMLTLLLMVGFVLSCNDEVMKEVDEVMKTTTQMEVPEELRPRLEELQKKYPDAEFIYIETDGDNIQSLLKLQDFDPKTIGYVKIWEKKGRVGALVNNNGPLPRLESDLPEDVMHIVEQPAKPIGGYETFYKTIADSLQYPAAAREAGIEGKVYVRFIVNEQGEKTNIQVVKGIGYGCDEAALEAIKAAGNFTPPYQRGKAVKQAIILPVTFKLGKSNNNQPVKFASGKKVDENGIYINPDQHAKPNGGYNEFYKKINHSLQYPAEAKANSIEGKVYIQFIVETDGSLTSFKALKGIGYGCEEAAIAAIKSGGRFVPAVDDGISVQQKIVLPISFKLGSENPAMIELGKASPSNNRMMIVMRKEGSAVVGRVLDFANKKPVPDVNIVIEGTNRGTVTDENGKYRLEVSGGEKLHFSHVSFASKVMTLQK